MDGRILLNLIFKETGVIDWRYYGQAAGYFDTVINF